MAQIEGFLGAHVRHGPDVFSLFAGFVIGFVFGCCGLVIAATFFRQSYLPGAAIGLVARIALNLLVFGATMPVANVEVIETIQFGDDGSYQGSSHDVPWEMLLAFGVATLSLVGAIGAVVYLVAGPRDDDDDDGSAPPPPSRPKDGEWVTFTR